MAILNDLIVQGNSSFVGDVQGSKFIGDLDGTSTNADKVDGLHVVKITKAAYNALATKDPNTLYVISD